MRRAWGVCAESPGHMDSEDMRVGWVGLVVWSVWLADFCHWILSLEI